MPYTIVFRPSAKRELHKLPKQSIKIVSDAIDALAINPRPTGYKKLVSKTSFRIRVGNYRIVYDIQDKQLVIEVLKVADRKEVYR